MKKKEKNESRFIWYSILFLLFLSIACIIIFYTVVHSGQKNSNESKAPYSGEFKKSNYYIGEQKNTTISNLSYFGEFKKAVHDIGHSREEVVINKNLSENPLISINKSKYHYLNLDHMDILENNDNDSAAFLIVNNLKLGANDTKTIYLNTISNSQSICLKDENVFSINGITEGCNDTGETLMHCPGSIEKYKCSYINNMYIISGFEYLYSGAREMVNGNESASENPIQDIVENAPENISHENNNTCSDFFWAPPASTICSGISFTQSSNCGNERSVVGTKDCDCMDSSWTPLASTICSNISFTQLSNCGNERSVVGTKDCGCSDFFWAPPASTICSGISFTQLSNCGNERSVVGTKDCGCLDSSWAPLASTICSNISFTQLSNCGNERSVVGTKDCDPKPILFILSGQSNMVGLGNKDDIEPGETSILEIPSNVDFYLRESWESSPRLIKSLNEQTYRQNSNKPHLGPEISLMHRLSEKYPERKIIIVKFAVGGTTIHHWNPNYDEVSSFIDDLYPGIGDFSEYRYLYRKLMDSVRFASEKYPSVIYGGMFWYQGESDAINFNNDFLSLTKNMITNIRLDVERSDMPFFLVKITVPDDNCLWEPDFGTPSEDVLYIRDQQDLIAEQLSNVYIIDTNDLICGADKIHLRADSQIILGNRMYNEYLKFYEPNL